VVWARDTSGVSFFQIVYLVPSGTRYTIIIIVYLVYIVYKLIIIVKNDRWWYICDSVLFFRYIDHLRPSFGPAMSVWLSHLIESSCPWPSSATSAHSHLSIMIEFCSLLLLIMCLEVGQLLLVIISPSYT